MTEQQIIPEFFFRLTPSEVEVALSELGWQNITSGTAIRDSSYVSADYSDRVDGNLRIVVIGVRWIGGEMKHVRLDWSWDPDSVIHVRPGDKEAETLDLPTLGWAWEVIQRRFVSGR